MRVTQVALGLVALGEGLLSSRVARARCGRGRVHVGGERGERTIVHSAVGDVSLAQPRGAAQSWPLWPVLPLAPYGYRKTIARTRRQEFHFDKSTRDSALTSERFGTRAGGVRKTPTVRAHT